MKDDPSVLRFFDWRALTPVQRGLLTRLLVRHADATRARAIGAALRAAWRGLLRRQRYRHELGELAAMDDLALRDIGISRCEVCAAIRSGDVLGSTRR